MWIGGTYWLPPGFSVLPQGSPGEMPPSSDMGTVKACPISKAPTHDSTHLGLARGSGSFRAFPTGFFSASSAVTRWNSASTLPCTMTKVSGFVQVPMGCRQPSRKSVIMWEIARKYSDYHAVLFYEILLSFWSWEKPFFRMNCNSSRWDGTDVTVEFCERKRVMHVHRHACAQSHVLFRL